MHVYELGGLGRAARPRAAATVAKKTEAAREGAKGVSGSDWLG